MNKINSYFMLEIFKLLLESSFFCCCCLRWNIHMKVCTLIISIQKLFSLPKYLMALFNNTYVLVSAQGNASHSNWLCLQTAESARNKTAYRNHFICYQVFWVLSHWNILKKIWEASKPCKLTLHLLSSTLEPLDL